MRIVDYRPTVGGHGLWIIEAKAPEAPDSLNDVLSQAWLYATHPEVDVPLMAIADGTRFAVYDVTHLAWDEPVVDITVSELSTRFDGLVSFLGAANVMRSIRTQQLRHLAAAMAAEVDPARLTEIAAEVRRLAKEALPIVLRHRSMILRHQSEAEDAESSDLRRDYGLFGLAASHNQPLAASLVDAERAAEYVRSLPASQKRREIEAFIEAARPTIDFATGQPHKNQQPARMFWMLRVIALATYLLLREDEDCGDDTEVLARSAIRDQGRRAKRRLRGCSNRGG